MWLHFISGLPRAGSTLLSAILRQNPRFHAGIQSPLSHIVMSLQNAMASPNESHQWISDDFRRHMLIAAFTNYYRDRVPADRNGEPLYKEPACCFDSNRAWCAKVDLIAELFPDSKIICMVRSISWILNSLETQFRRNPLTTSKIYGHRANTNVYGRVNQVLAADGMVGYSMNALREAFWSDHAERLCFIPYEHLIAKPNETLAKLYDFLGEPMFVHDLAKLEEIPGADRFDDTLGSPGLHHVGPALRTLVAQERDWILPIDLFQAHQGSPFWNEPQLNRKKMLVL